MPLDTVQAELTLPEKNSIKNKMALAYMHALNSTVNYHFNENAREVDGLGLDLTLVSALVGRKRTIASGASQINIQLKGVAESSVSMFSEDADNITYNLSDDLIQFGLAMYLVVVVLPADSDIENWRVINEMDVLLKARGFYCKVEGTLSSGRIQIPKSQKLTPETYRQLFVDLSDEVNL
jgi:hypothetical protein